MPGLLTSQEIAVIVDACAQELERKTVAAEADQHRDEAAIITAARDLKLNPRPAGHNTTAWIADCARISSRSPPLATNFIVVTVNETGDRRSLRRFAKTPSEIKSLVT
jgi:hypothetical protein